MDVTFIYMILLAICIVLRFWWGQYVKTRIDNRNIRLGHALRSDEKIASMTVTGVDHYTKSMRGRQLPEMCYNVKFSYYDEEGQQYFGVYSTDSQGEIDTVNKVAYNVLAHDQYRVLGRKQFHVSRRTMRKGSLIDMLFDYLITSFLNQSSEDKVKTVLNIGIVIFTILVVYGFYCAVAV